MKSNLLPLLGLGALVALFASSSSKGSNAAPSPSPASGDNPPQSKLTDGELVLDNNASMKDSSIVARVPEGTPVDVVFRGPFESTGYAWKVNPIGAGASIHVTESSGAQSTRHYRFRAPAPGMTVLFELFPPGSNRPREGSFLVVFG